MYIVCIAKYHALTILKWKEKTKQVIMELTWWVWVPSHGSVTLSCQQYFLKKPFWTCQNAWKTVSEHVHYARRQMNVISMQI